MENKIFHVLTVYIKSHSAEAMPPLGTILGNLGVNAIKFCKEFNEFTEELPGYITLGVSITVLENRSFSFRIISGPSMGHLLELLKFERVLKITQREGWKEYYCISLKSVIQLTILKFPRVPLKMCLPVTLGVIKAASLIILEDEDF